MSSNVVKLLGVIVSVLVIYLCVDGTKDEIATKFGINETVSVNRSIKPVQNSTSEKVNEHTNQTQEEINKVVEVVQNTEKSDAAFGMIIGENITIVGMFSPEISSGVLINYIDQMCRDNECDNDIRYSEDIKNITWQNDIVDLIKLLREAKIENASIFVNSNTLKIEGDFASLSDKIQTISQKLKSDGLIIFGEKSKKNISPATTKETTKIVEPNIPVEKSIGQNSNNLQEQIDNIIKNNNITFMNNNNVITPESMKILDQISALIMKSKNIKFDIASYTKIDNDPVFSKVISQKKADIVKKYFLKKGLNPGQSIGYGEEKETQIKIIINK